MGGITWRTSRRSANGWAGKLNEMIGHRATTLGLLVGCAAFPTASLPCTALADISSVQMVNAADAIVRATAVQYAVAQVDPLRTTGVPESKVRFKVVETIRGPVTSDVILPGYLLDSDESGELTVNWYGLGPVNERLHSDQDAWLIWVRKQGSRMFSRFTRSAATPALAGALPRWWPPETPPSL